MQIPITRAARGSALAACALAFTLAGGGGQAAAAPAALDLRIEGATSTIYEGPVTSDGHVVRPASGDDHSCDGTNGGANPAPGPTPTSALDDGARVGGYSWDGQYFTSFQDYLISRIGPDSANSSQFWGQYVNSQASQVGGCQEIVKSGDEVLWAFDAFSKQHVLRLAGPTAGHTGEPLNVKVTDGADGTPLAGASVGGTSTGADGVARLTFSRPGIYRLKAERADSVRSNALSVCIDPPDVEACTSTDRTEPSAQLLLPTLLSDTSRSRAFSVSWQGKDVGGSGVSSYNLDVRAPGGTWRALVRKTALTRARFRGVQGRSYEFRVSAVDRAGNRSRFAHDAVAVPIDDRDRRLVRFSRGWDRLERRGAWGGFVRRSTRAGATVRVRVHGSRVALIGRRLRRGGRVRISIGARSAVVGLRGRAHFRDVLYMTTPLRRGAHTVRLEALGPGPVEIDAVAVLP